MHKLIDKAYEYDPVLNVDYIFTRIIIASYSLRFNNGPA